MPAVSLVFVMFFHVRHNLQGKFGEESYYSGTLNFQSLALPSFCLNSSFRPHIVTSWLIKSEAVFFIPPLWASSFISPSVCEATVFLRCLFPDFFSCACFSQ